MNEPERFLSTRQIAERLSISTLTVRRLIASGRLPAVHPTPRLVRVRESDVLALLAEPAAPLAAQGRG